MNEHSFESEQEDTTNEYLAAEDSSALDLQYEADANLEEDKIQSF